MKTLFILLALAVLALLWMRHENTMLQASFDRANRVASEQKTLAGMLKNQLRVATDRADKNELAQVDMRRKLDAAAQRDAEQEKTITRLLNENVEFRRWYGADLPDAVRRLHHRPACVDASDCLQRLPESEPVPDAGQRPTDERRFKR
ncbi:protein lysB [Kluyvera intermedia]|uniref:Protein lysB n=1 Tax=Kluyvera intermedia TaxID=61648 RepID=A0ABX3UIV2_KLUIN|nr:protein lysB [Kluyvera intermedia]